MEFKGPLGGVFKFEGNPNKDDTVVDMMEIVSFDKLPKIWELVGENKARVLIRFFIGDLRSFIKELEHCGQNKNYSDAAC